MASGIRIPFVADVRDWVRGTRKIRDDLDDVERDLENVAREADDSAGDIERDFENAGRDIADVFRDIERKAEDSFDDIERSAQNVDIPSELAKSTRRERLAEAGAELGDELAENAGEGFRSGDFGSTVFETLTSLAPALGVAGVAIGGIAGVAGGIMRGIEEEAANIKAAASNLFAGIAGDAELSGRQAAEAYRRGYLEAADIDDQLESVFGVDSLEEAWEKVDQKVQQTGLTAEEVSLAYIGNADAVDTVSAALAANQSKYEEILDEQGRVFDTDRARWRELEAQKEQLDDQARGLEAILNKGRPLEAQNERNLELWRTRRDVLKDVENTGPPDFSSLVRQLSTIKSDAERAKWAIDNMPTTRTVTVNVKQTRGSGGRPILDQDV